MSGRLGKEGSRFRFDFLPFLPPLLSSSLHTSMKKVTRHAPSRRQGGGRFGNSLVLHIERVCLDEPVVKGVLAHWRGVAYTHPDASNCLPKETLRNSCMRCQC